MRTVMPTLDVCRAWARQSQPTARNRRGTVYYDGLTIYSYGAHYPIARIWPKDILLVNSGRRSVTTARHRGWVIHAFRSERPQWCMWVVPCPWATYAQEHKENFSYLQQETLDTIVAVPEAHIENRGRRLDWAVDCWKSAHEYHTRFLSGPLPLAFTAQLPILQELAFRYSQTLPDYLTITNQEGICNSSRSHS